MDTSVIFNSEEGRWDVSGIPSLHLHFGFSDSDAVFEI